VQWSSTNLIYTVYVNKENQITFICTKNKITFMCTKHASTSM